MPLITKRGEQFEYVETESGLKLFSSTQVRKAAHDAYAGIPAAVLEKARRRGTLLHRRFWKLLAFRADLLAYPAPIVGLEGSCKAMDEWADKNTVRPIRIEFKSLNRKLGYAGQVDAQILYGSNEILTLADLKTGEPTMTDPMQLLAYNEMEGLKSEKLLDLYVRADGTYREVVVTRRDTIRDWPAFLNARNLLMWRVSR